MDDENKPQVNIDELTKAFNGDLDLMLFYATWIKNGCNASKAYKELHPDVTDHSARVLGSTNLARISKEHIMTAYGLDHQTYFTQLKEGIEATKWNDFTGDREADHTTRSKYHDKLGKLLGIENQASTLIQVNNTGEMSLDFFGDESKVT